nr:hypothetical protein [Tanacetum cinerariifolium]
MLAPGNYIQWKSRIKRYIDTKPNNELIHYCVKNPPYKFTWADKQVLISEGSYYTTTKTYMETYKNVSQDIRDQLNAKAEAVQIILTGIDNDIYSTVDACPNVCEMWKAIESLKQGESINMMNELIRNQCDVTNHQVNVQFLLQLQLEWQRFVTLVKESQELKTVSYHKLYDILKQHQNEVNEIRAERIAQVSPDAADSGPIFDAEPLQKIDQNDDDDDLANERELLASLIEKLKCEIDDSKNRNKFLETSNKVSIEQLKDEIEDFKNQNKSLESSNNRFKEANNKLSETNKLMYNDFKKSQAELQKRNDVEYVSKVEIDCEKAKGDLISYKMESQKSFNKYTQTINDLNQKISEMKKKLSAHQETISILNRGKSIVNSPQPIYDQEPSMVAEDDETSKDKEIDKLMALISLSFKKIYKPTNNNLRTSSNTSRENQDNSPRINRSTGYENQRIGNVAGARETVGSTVVHKSEIQCYNCKEFGHVARECQKPKRVKDAAYHREKMLLCKQEEAGIQLNAEQADWRDDTDDESKDQELEARYMYMAQIEEVSPDAADSGPIFDTEPLQKVSTDDHYNVFAIESEHLEQYESIHDTYPIEQDEHNVIIDSLDMSYDRKD